MVETFSLKNDAGFVNVSYDAQEMAQMPLLIFVGKMDIESVEVLEALLTEFCGGFVLVSHDRQFVSHVSDRIYTLDVGRLGQI